MLREQGATRSRRRSAAIDGHRRSARRAPDRVPQIEVEVDLQGRQAYGVKPGDVRRAAATLLAGEEVGDIFRDGKAYDVQVWSTPETRHSVSDIENLLIDTPDRASTVPLGEHRRRRASEPTPNRISHERLARRSTSTPTSRAATSAPSSADVEAALAEVEFPLGYHAGAAWRVRRARRRPQSRLLLFAIGAAIGVFLLLQASFGSTRLAILVFLTLPSALVGGVLAACFRAASSRSGSLVGFLTVLGIAARNGIMMINHFQHLERDEGEPFGPDLVIRGARERLSPILMTALATGLALVPLAIAGDLPGHEIEHPMAIVILGGLVTSTLLNLFVVPSLYLRFARPAPRPDLAAPSPSAI